MQYFDEMPPPFSEDDVLKHNLAYIEKAGKQVGHEREVPRSPC